MLLIDNTIIADSPWTWQTKDTVEANGSYSWDTTNIASGSHTITILSFDEHGSNNAPSTTTITVNKPSPATPTPYPTTYVPSTPHPTIKPTAQPSNTPAIPTPTLPTSSPSENPQASSSNSLMQYIDGAIVVTMIIVGTVSMTSYIWLKRKK